MKKHRLFSLLLVLWAPVWGWAQSDLIISEMHYNQSGPDATEFIEIQNVSDEPIDLAGYQFTRGVLYTFPAVGSVLQPGAYFVLVTPGSNFATVHPGVPVKGTYADDDLPASYPGALAGGGERITLLDNLGSEVLDFTYDDKDPWPELPDGEGFTLVAYRTDGSGDPDTPGFWVPSIHPGGSPGAAEPNPGVLPVLINEIRTRDGVLSNDAVELYNPNPDPVNIGNWYLSDSTSGTVAIDERKSYRIPANTMIPGNGYLTFNETTLGFGLSSQGELVYLWSGDGAGNLTGYVHGFVFEPAADGVSFGRHINGDGIEQFVQMSSLTLGDTNSAPRIDEVVIMEIMYNPLNGIEFVEIENTGASSVPLFDPLNPTVSWKLSGFGFTFPFSTTLAAGEIVVVANTNATVFRANYDVPAATRVFGGATGTLSNGGEHLALVRPENLDTLAVPAVFSYITVDAVTYGDSGRWPSTPDGFGKSLTRRVAAAYGNESDNWRASLQNGGSPGWSTEYTGLPIYINEALTHTDLPRVDAIELYNPNDTAVNVGGWFLTDDNDAPRRWKIPSGTTIPGKSYWAVNEDNDGDPDNNASLPFTYFGRGFSLSSRGEQVYLYSATTDQRLSGYAHGFRFNAAENGVSFGRHIDADGEEHFVPQTAITIGLDIGIPNPPGMTNSAPRVGAVVINEIFYDTQTNQVEFVELLNRSGSTVNLYDDSPLGDDGNNWGITNGVHMQFPGMQPTLGPGERIVIIPFGTDVAGFRSSNNVPPGVTIYGGADGFVGSLRNGGERITLTHPDKPDEVPIGSGNFIIPWIDVDTVEYDDDPPWPNVGAGGGRSIERINPAQFSDESTNWRVSNPAGGTPGVDNSTGVVYATWALATFTVEELATPGLTGPDDDFNNDGLPNVLSYISGKDPRVATTLDELSSYAIVDSGGQDYLVIEHLRRNDGSDITWGAERTSDLINGPWEPANTSAIPPVDNGDGSSTWTARDTLPLSGLTYSVLHVFYTLAE